MKKLLIFMLILIFAFSCCGCLNNVYYKDLTGYKEYISDRNSGYKDIPYYCVEDSMTNNSNAREYYIHNSRRVGNYLITDYLDGVCINKYYGDASYRTISIPQFIDNKPVIKLGAYLDGEDIVGAFGGNVSVKIILSSSVKVISSVTIMSARWMIPENSRYQYVDINSFDVDENNKYYSSNNGSLYTKDFKKLLWLNNNEGNELIIPEYVEIFEPSNGIEDLLKSVTIGKNIKKINTFIDRGENGTEPDKHCIPDVKIRGYKNTAAEKWAKENYAKFVPIDTE